MKESPLMIKSKAVALDVIKVCKDLRNARRLLMKASPYC